MSALTWAEDHGYDTLTLSVWRQLAKARQLYRAHGFVTREQVYSPADPEADDVMVATLPWPWSTIGGDRRHSDRSRAGADSDLPADSRGMETTQPSAAIDVGACL